MLGIRDARQLRPLLDELAEQGKIEIADGQISNTRVMKELATANQKIADASKGGHAKAAKRPAKPKTLKSLERALPKQVPAGHQRGTSTPFKQAGIEENQTDNICSPSPSPSNKNSNYAFDGEVIHVTDDLFADWEKSYSNIPNLKAQLQSRDTWLATQSEADRKKWIHSTAAWLANKDADFAKAAIADDLYADPFIGVETDSW